ncbi:MAG: hypothetical protein Q4B52_03850 [Tissierellia bacterium]|nr:hypothetical protein [Tissierellia bacterium]
MFLKYILYQDVKKPEETKDYFFTIGCWVLVLFVIFGINYIFNNVNNLNDTLKLFLRIYLSIGAICAWPCFSLRSELKKSEYVSSLLFNTRSFLGILISPFLLIYYSKKLNQKKEEVAE